MRALLGSVLRTRRRGLPSAWRNGLAVAASIALAIAAVWAWRASDFEAEQIRWWPIAASFVAGGSLSVLMKAVGYVVAAHLVGQQPPAERAVRIAVVSSAANLLPVPGSLLVTVRSLAQDGSSYDDAIAAGAVPALSWISFAGVVGGGAIMLEGSPGLGALVVLAGLAALAAAVVAFRRVAPRTGRRRLVVELVVAQAGWLVASALRLGLAMAALGIEFRAARAFALSVAGAASTAIGFVPGGVGVREALIAALAPELDLTVEAGVLLGALDRVIWMAFLALAVAVVTLTGRGRPVADGGPAAVSID